MTERHAWLRKALADRSFAAADVARAWGCHDAVLTRFIKTGEPKITAFRVNALSKLLDVSTTELLAQLSERPIDYSQLRDMPISIVAGFAGLLGMDVPEVLAKLESPRRRRSKRDNGTTDEYGGW